MPVSKRDLGTFTPSYTIWSVEWISWHHPRHVTQNANKSKDLIFPYIGWRIWKFRNELLYKNKRWSISDIISQAILDFRLWQEAQKASTHKNLHQTEGTKPITTSIQQVLPFSSPYYCCTNGSWVDLNATAGIGWVLHNAQGRCILKGASLITPTNSALETEAIALREALLQIKLLNYRQVTFCGDCFTLYHHLEIAVTRSQPKPGLLKIQGHLEDIIAMAKGSYHFKFIGRQMNVIADALAKNARLQNLPDIVSWVH